MDNSKILVDEIDNSLKEFIINFDYLFNKIIKSINYYSYPYKFIFNIFL